MKLKGVVVYEGPSRLTGDPIVAIVTFATHNEKTGDMAQAWVLRQDVSPSDAIADGGDDAICGDCVHRSGGTEGRSCYVVWWLAPTAVWKAYRAGLYPVLEPHDAARYLAGQQLRLTAYGDIAAAPYDVWRALLEHVDGWTAYTHQWRTCDQRLRQFAMASVESERERDEASAIGWRTFRTRLLSERVRPDEIGCPASNEAGRLRTCAECGLCVGNERPTARSIAIIAHGQRVAWLREKKQAVTV